MIKDVSTKPIGFHVKEPKIKGCDFSGIGEDNVDGFQMSKQMERAVTKLKFFFDINTPIICIQNHDFARFDLIIKKASGNRNVEEWNPILGRTDFDSQQATNDSPINARTSLDEFINARLSVFSDDILVLKDVQSFLKEDDYQTADVISALHYSAYRKLYDKSIEEPGVHPSKCHRGYNQTVIILSSVPFPMPKTLAPYVEYLDLEYPDADEIEYMIKRHIEVSDGKVQDKLSEEQRKSMIRSLQGMSAFDIDRLLDTVISENANLTGDDTRAIREKQRQVIRNSGLLELIDSDIEESEIGGLDYLLDYLSRKAEIMRDIKRAEDYGVDIPKGVLLVGMPGCGKSLSAKMAAKMFNNIPLLKMDMGSLQGGYVGDSERNMREALKQAEQAAPCILWIDEIEKAFAGTSGGSESYTMRMFGYFLSWMQDHTKPVFVFATANDVKDLKPEFLRAGRFDEKFVLNLPGDEEKKKIFKARLGRKSRNLSGCYHDSDIDSFVKECKGFNGADIENAINSTLEDMYYTNKDKKCFKDCLLETLKKTKGIAVSQEKKIKEIEEKIKENSFVDATGGPDKNYKRKEKRQDFVSESSQQNNSATATNSGTINANNSYNKLKDFDLG